MVLRRRILAFRDEDIYESIDCKQRQVKEQRELIYNNGIRNLHQFSLVKAFERNPCIII